MAQVIVTLKVMPESPDVDLVGLEKKVREAIEAYGGMIAQVTVEPVAFGLKALNVIFGVVESRGSTDALEEQISAMEDVSGCQVIDVRRAFG